MKKNRGLWALVPALAALVTLILAACASSGGGGSKNTKEDTKEEYSRTIDQANEYLAAGNSYLEQNQYEKALEEYQKSLAELDKADKLSMNLGLGRHEDGRRLIEDRKAREIPAEQAEQERLAQEKAAVIAAANAKGVTAADFEYDATRDGRGIVIKRYKGQATIVNIPAVIEGLPVTEFAGEPLPITKT